MGVRGHNLELVGQMQGSLHCTPAKQIEQEREQGGTPTIMLGLDMHVLGPLMRQAC